jgi:hypothetical protein
MMISVMAMLMLTTATTTLTGQIRPARTSVNAGEATAAAQAGIENFLSWVNTNCPPTDGFTCANLTTGKTNKSGITDPLNQQGVRITGGDGAQSVESYWWTVTFATSGLARVKSVGQVPTNKANPKYLIKTLVADVNAMPSFNNFQYYTKYETYSAEFVNSFYRARTVQVTSTASLNGTSISSKGKPGSLQWSGACSYVDATTTPLCDSTHSTNVCDDLYYPNGTGPGRGTNTAWNNATRRPSTATQDAMGTSSSFAYFAEGGSYTAGGTPTSVTHNDTCDSSMEPNMVMNGPVYSQDAYLVDRGKDTGNSKNSRPNFDDSAYTVWTGTINGTPQPAGPNGGYDRAYPGTDGSATLTSNYPSDTSGNKTFPIYQSTALELPPDATEALPMAQCVYTGPTRIKIVGTMARVTSPLTPAGSSACYRSTGTFTNVNTVDSAGQSTTDPSGGVVNAQVPISRTLIYVKNPDSAIKPTQATVASPVFNTTTSLTLPAASTANTLAGSWTDNASYTTALPCPSPADAAKRRNFDCETGKSTPKNDVFTAIKTATNTELATANPTTASLTSAITGQLSTASQKVGTTKGSVWYTVTVTAAASASTAVTPEAATGTFLQTTVGSGYTTTTDNWNVNVSRVVCGSLTKQNNCVNTTTPIVQGVLSQTSSAATGSPMNSTQNFPWHGKQPGDAGYDAAKTYTDPNNDITPYYHGYGDVYVDGTTDGNVSILAEHDIIVTNDLTYADPTVATTSDGLALIANHNVRIYRPMTCATDGALGATTAGYCPNDLSGVYTDNLTWPVANNYPSYMYKPSNAPSMTNGGAGSIYATIFTLRGSFMADNFYRGAIGYGVDIYGGLYQYHRGATSMPYQGRPYQGSGTKMPGISVTYNYDNMRAGQAVNGGLRVPYIPPPDGRLTSNTWNVISISTGG